MTIGGSRKQEVPARFLNSGIPLDVLRQSAIPAVADRPLDTGQHRHRESGVGLPEQKAARHAQHELEDNTTASSKDSACFLQQVETGCAWAVEMPRRLDEEEEITYEDLTMFGNAVTVPSVRAKFITNCADNVEECKVSRGGRRAR